MSLKSKRSVLPHWDGETYSRIAAPSYDLVTNITGWQKHLAESALDGLTPGRLLDVGCGTGHVLNDAAQRGFDGVGIDSSEGMLERACSRPYVQKSMLVRASATSLPFPDNEFDVVFASGSLVHVHDIALAVSEILRVAKPGGTIRIVDHLTPIKRSLSTPLALLFSQLSGDIIHDYPGHFSRGADLIERKTLGRGGILQQLDFTRREQGASELLP